MLRRMMHIIWTLFNPKPDDFLRQFTQAFAFLFERHGFVLIEAKDFQFNGAWHAVAASPDMRIRLTGDRGDEIVDVSCADSANSEEDWLGLELIATLVNGRDFMKTSDFAELGNFLADNYASVKDLLSPHAFPATKQKIRRLGEERARKLFPGGYG